MNRGIWYQSPSSVPLINLYLLNIGQAIVVIFLAADFLKRDKKLDTNEVLYTRSMSNFEYVIGKTWGILRLFLGLDIMILSIGLLMNIISKSMSIDFMSYISYLLIIMCSNNSFQSRTCFRADVGNQKSGNNIPYSSWNSST